MLILNGWYHFKNEIKNNFSHYDYITSRHKRPIISVRQKLQIVHYRAGPAKCQKCHKLGVVISPRQISQHQQQTSNNDNRHRSFSSKNIERHECHKMDAEAKFYSWHFITALSEMSILLDLLTFYVLVYSCHLHQSADLTKHNRMVVSMSETVIRYSSEELL